jgi:Fe-S-cluster containining protein
MCESTCGNAVEPVDGASRLFRADTKCCTYFPRLPNYLAGAILSDDSPELAEGRRRIEARIRSRVGVTPLSLGPPARYSLLYRSGRDAFGKARSLRCPYYSDEGSGLCTIWRHREAVCSTFFCKHVAGEDGRRFWSKLKGYLALVETQLSRYALLQLDPDYLLSGRDPSDSERALDAGELDELPPSPESYARIWGAWLGREEELYRKSYSIARALDPERVRELLGFDGTLSEAMVRAALERATNPSLPARLGLNPAATVRWLPDGSVGLGAYSEVDAVAVSEEAFRLVREFQGKELVEEVRGRLRSELQADLSDEVLLELYRHRVLVEPA